MKLFKPSPVNPYSILGPLFLAFIFLLISYVGYDRGAHIVQIGFVLIMGLLFLYGGISTWLYKKKIKGYKIEKDKITVKGTTIEIPFDMITKVEIAPSIKKWYSTFWPYGHVIRREPYGYSNITQTTALATDQVFIFTKKKVGPFLSCYILSPVEAKEFVKELRKYTK